MSDAEIRAAIEAKMRKKNKHIDMIRQEMQPVAVEVICTAIMQRIDANAHRTWGADLAKDCPCVGKIRCDDADDTHAGIFADFPKYEIVDWARYADTEPMSLAVALSFLHADTNRVRECVIDQIATALHAGPYATLFVTGCDCCIFVDYATPNYAAIKAEVRLSMLNDARERSARVAAATSARRTPKSAAATH